MTDLQHIFSAHDLLGEGPVWDPMEQTLYWVNIEAGQYHRLDPATGLHQLFEVGGMLGVLALREKGGMVMATDHGFVFWDPVSGKLEPISDPEAGNPLSRFNDGSVDRAGRFWAGSMGDGCNNHLYRLDADLSVHLIDSGICVSNGIGWSPDNRVMYYTDSDPHLIYAYDFDLATGTAENRRVFIDSSDASGVPDGLTVDSQGFIWSARWDGWRIERYDPQGKLERSIPMPVQRPTSVMFGGPNLDVLYITSARMEFSDEELTKQPLAGDLFAMQVDVKGLPETRFAG